MSVYRTPDDRFSALDDWPYEPTYVEVDTAIGSIRIASVETGPTSADPVLLMHGEPTWGYLYRHMIPLLVETGHRVVVPDLVGFGRSDKPLDPEHISYQTLVDVMSAWLQTTDHRNLTLLCQDWGGLVGLRLVAQHPERFDRLMICNTALPTGDTPMPDAFGAWVQFCQTVEEFPTGAIIEMGTTRSLSASERAGYDAPFPTEESKAWPRALPRLVPTNPDTPDAHANRDAWRVLEEWTKPTLVMFSDADPITAGGQHAFIDRIPGAQGQPHRILPGGGHFLQEDIPRVLVSELTDFVARTRPH